MSSSSGHYGATDASPVDEAFFQTSAETPLTVAAPTSSSSSSSSRGGNGNRSRRFMATMIAVVMAVVGASILVSRSRSAGISSVNTAFTFYGRPQPISSTTSTSTVTAGGRGGKSAVSKGATTVKASGASSVVPRTTDLQDGMGNVIFDYGTTANDYAVAGEVVIEAKQVGGICPQTVHARPFSP